MKTIFNKQKRSVAGVLIALTALTTALTGCQEDFELDLPLAVSARELSLTKDAGSTHVLDGALHASREVGLPQQTPGIRQ